MECNIERDRTSFIVPVICSGVDANVILFEIKIDTMTVGIFRKISDMWNDALKGKGFLGAVLPALNKVVDAGAKFMQSSVNPLVSTLGTGLQAANNTLGNLMSTVPQQGDVSDLIKFKV